MSEHFLIDGTLEEKKYNKVYNILIKDEKDNTHSLLVLDKYLIDTIKKYFVIGTKVRCGGYFSNKVQIVNSIDFLNNNLNVEE
ncbi:MAG: hypothetical protein ABSG25_05700 [Bryobacteraceae bacterium]